MNRAPDFDLAKAHDYFAAYCFNWAWDLIEKADRSEADDRMMIALAHASIFHWTQRPDCDARRLSTGYWQASRVHALIGDAAEALRLGEIALVHSPGLPPFFVAYAHEAVARALTLLGRPAEAAVHLEAARAQVPMVKTQEDRDRILADLATIG